jgi:multiple antibiotic resistance protein
MTLIEYAVLAFTSLFVIMEPFSTTAVFMSLTQGMDDERKRKIISKSMIVSALVLFFFAITGNLLFLVLGITVSAFEIAGGLLLITVAIKMLYPPKENQSSYNLEDIAVMPIAIPLTAGPGTITTVILLSSQAKSLLEIPFLYIGIILAIAISYVVMRYSNRLGKIMGHDGLRVLTALMAILILAIAVQFVINGIDGAIKQFLG